MVVGSTREAYVAKSKTNRPHEEFLITTNVAQLETVLININTTTLYDGIDHTSKSRAERNTIAETKGTQRRRAEGRRESVYIRTPHARMNTGKT